MMVFLEILLWLYFCWTILVAHTNTGWVFKIMNCTSVNTKYQFSNYSSKYLQIQLAWSIFFFCSLSWLLKSLWGIHWVHALITVTQSFNTLHIRVHKITPSDAAYIVPWELRVEWSKAPAWALSWEGKILEYKNKKLSLI